MSIDIVAEARMAIDDIIEKVQNEETRFAIYQHTTINKFKVKLSERGCRYFFEGYSPTTEEIHLIGDYVKEVTTFENAYVHQFIYAEGHCRNCVVYVDEPRSDDENKNIFVVAS